MGIKAWFTKKPTVRAESAKDLKNRVVEVLDFSEWIQRLKNEAGNATIRVKRTHQVKGESTGYLGDPIVVSQVEASTFDRLLDQLFGGGSYILEYWQGDHRLMMKNSKPPMPVTHTIPVAGIPKPLPGKKAAAESTGQPKTVLGILLKQLDTSEGIVALTALLTLAKDFFFSGKKESGTFKDMIDSMGVIFGMIPTPPDEIEQLERYQKLSGIFAASARPPVNIGGGSTSPWDGVAKVLGQVLGTAIANAQNNGGQKQELLKATGVQANLPQSQVADALAGSAATPPGSEVGTAASPTAPSPPASPTPQAMFVNAKIMSIQAGMQANIEPFAIANDLWSLLVFIIEKGIVNDAFVQSLYADPHRAFDQIISLYAPQSASYPKLDEVKRIVVGYILEEAQEEAEIGENLQKEPQEPEPDGEKSADKIHIVDFPKPEPEGDSEEPAPEQIRTEPIVITENDPVVVPREGTTSSPPAFVPVAPEQEPVTTSGED